MKYRILQVTEDSIGTITFRAQFKPWWSIKWTNISMFYVPEICEMPGWRTEIFIDETSALLAVLAHKTTGTNVVNSKVIHQE